MRCAEEAQNVYASALAFPRHAPRNFWSLCLAELVVSWRTKADLSAHAGGESVPMNRP